MATSTNTLNYMGRAEQPVEWAALLRIFDTVCGPEARSLPKYPKIIGAVHASWQDASGVEHEADFLDEVGQAYQQYETFFISFRGYKSDSEWYFEYWPATATAWIRVRMGDRRIAEQYIAVIRTEFPLIATTATYDVFISYASGDSALAMELKSDFEHHGWKCFMAEKDIPVAADWQDTIRTALRRSQRILILLTPRSLDKPWVLLETGAAWVLEKELIPVLVQVDPSRLVEPIRRYQARVIETTAQRMALVTELTST
jgi:TIR domain.